MPHDRRHDLNAREADSPSAEDHTGERDVRLSAKSLAARGDAPDGSEDGSARRASGRTDPATSDIAAQGGACNRFVEPCLHRAPPR